MLRTAMYKRYINSIIITIIKVVLNMSVVVDSD